MIDIFHWETDNLPGGKRHDTIYSNTTILCEIQQVMYAQPVLGIA